MRAQFSELLSRAGPPGALCKAFANIFIIQKGPPMPAAGSSENAAIKIPLNPALSPPPPKSSVWASQSRFAEKRALVSEAEETFPGFTPASPILPPPASITMPKRLRAECSRARSRSSGAAPAEQTELCGRRHLFGKAAFSFRDSLRECFRQFLRLPGSIFAKKSADVFSGSKEPQVLFFF